MKMKKKKTTRRQEVKKKARKSLSAKFTKQRKSYVVDTSAVVNKFLSSLIKKGISGKLIIPNALMAELENMANKGKEEGFIGLEEIAKLHKIRRRFSVYFYGLRPSEHQIRFAKSGEIDALIREIARKTKSALITSDLVQAKSAQAYNLEVIYLKPKEQPKKKRKFLFWKY
jgi:ATPase